jgi:hypothetical protein
MSKRRPSAKPKQAAVTYASFMKACEAGAKRLGIENWKPGDLFARRVA